MKRIRKQISARSVQGLALVREDLQGGRRIRGWKLKQRKGKHGSA